MSWDAEPSTSSAQILVAHLLSSHYLCQHPPGAGLALPIILLSLYLCVPCCPRPCPPPFPMHRFFLGNWNQAGFLAENRPIRTLRDILSRLRETYCSSTGYEVGRGQEVSGQAEGNSLFQHWLRGGHGQRQGIRGA